MAKKNKTKNPKKQEEQVSTTKKKPTKKVKNSDSFIEELEYNAGCRGSSGGCSSGSIYPEWIQCPSQSQYNISYF